MLIEVIKVNEVVSCRLTTGEELVARLKKDKRDDGYVELDTPLIVGRSAEGFGLQCKGKTIWIRCLCFPVVM